MRNSGAAFTPKLAALPPVTDELEMDDWDIPFIPETKPRKAEPRFTGLDSFARLVVKKRASGDAERFRGLVVALGTQSTQSLIVRIATTTDPLMLWALHSQLDKRGVAPAHRWPGNTSNPQMLFVSWCADLAWFIKRNPNHAPRFKSWQRLLKLVPCSSGWLDQAFWRFVGTHSRSLAHVTAKALALPDSARQELMTLPTLAMVAARRELDTERFEVTRSMLLSHAMTHRDKSGTYKPTDIANRRASLLRTHVLSGKHVPSTAKHWRALTGETTSRQTIARNIEAAMGALSSPAERE